MIIETGSQGHRLDTNDTGALQIVLGYTQPDSDFVGMTNLPASQIAENSPKYKMSTEW